MIHFTLLHIKEKMDEKFHNCKDSKTHLVIFHPFCGGKLIGSQLPTRIVLQLQVFTRKHQIYEGHSFPSLIIQCIY